MDFFQVQDDPSIQAASALPFNIPPTADGSYPEQFFTTSQTVEASQPRPGLGGRELYSKEQWEIQKPIIRQLYNIENQPFKRVINILQTKHNFFPTRRQFYRKISEWGYEKNIKDNEMRTILQHVDDRKNRGEDLNVDLKGQKIDPVKIHRWRKRHAKVKSVAYPFQSNSRENASSQRIYSKVDELELHQENARRPSIVLNKCNADVSQSPGHFEDRAMNYWNLVDVTDSPLLTRLFAALKIECEKPIPYLDLNSSSQSAAAQSTAAPDSDEEMAEDISPATWVDFSLGAASNDIVNYTHEILCGPYMLGTDLGSNPAELSFSEWSLREWDFSCDQPLKIDMKHLCGLSPYPTQAVVGRNRSSGVTNQSLYLRSLQIQERESKIKMRLRWSKIVFGVEHPKTLLAASDLGNIYWQQRKLRPAERLLRQVAVSCQKTYGLKHIATLNAYMGVVHVLLKEGEQIKALGIHQVIHDTIIKLVGKDDPLALASTSIQAIGLFTNGYFHEAEMIIRRVIQIGLHNFGLESQWTIFGMGLLGDIFMVQKKPADSERLMRIHLQISSKVDGLFSNSSLTAARRLSNVLMKQGRYNDCMELAKALVEKSQGPLTHESPEILSVLSDAAICARDQGQLSDKEHQLRTILERQIRCMGVEDPEVLATTNELSHVLSAMGHHAEAINLLERSYKQLVKSSGLTEVNTIVCCRRLARTYVDLGRWDDAMTLLKRNVDHAQEFGKYQTVDLLKAKEDLAEILWRKGHYREAVPLYKECYDTFIQVHNWSPMDIWLVEVVRRWSWCYEKLGLFEDAATISRQHLEDAVSSRGKKSLAFMDIVVNLARFLRKAGKYAEAMTYYEECLNGFPELQMSRYNSEKIQYGLPICYEELGRHDDMYAFCDKYGLVLGIEEVDKASAMITAQNP